METKNFILASSSPQRKQLLEQIGFAPRYVKAADIDETCQKGETPTAYVKRMALSKAAKVASDNPDKVVLGSDTIVVVGRQILHKAKTDEEQTSVMQLLSGKAHRVITAVCVFDTKGKFSLKVVSTRILMKKLTSQEIKTYVAGHEWVGCVGYKIEGSLSGFVKKIIGSYSGVVGLPLFETKNMLEGVGIK